MGEDGNSIKVNLIKQDDGGSPIRHYLVKYRAVSSSRPPFHLLLQLSHPPCWGNSTHIPGAKGEVVQDRVLLCLAGLRGPAQGFKSQDRPTAIRPCLHGDHFKTSEMNVVTDSYPD